MRYSILGKTGLKVSALGFGCMRLPMKNGKVDRELSTPLLRKAAELGVNFFDTAVMYCYGDSQAAMGDAFKGIREKVIISTKNHLKGVTPEIWRKTMEDSLKFVQTGYIDLYHHHGITWGDFVKYFDPDKGGLTKELLRAKEQGLVRHIGFSFHDKPENLIKLVDTGIYENVILQYNLLDQANADAMQYAHEKGMGVVVMGPVGGGRLGLKSEQILELTGGTAKSTVEAALRFVWGHRGVNVALSGMENIPMLEQNARFAEETKPFTEKELKTLNILVQERKEKSGVYCTACRYCMPGCSRGVEIPDNLDCLNQARIFGFTDFAKTRYNELKVKAAECIDCGKCVKLCPQKIRIPEKMKETALLLDPAAGNVTYKASLENIKKDGSFKMKVSAFNFSGSDRSPDISLRPDNTVEFDKTEISLPGMKAMERKKFKVKGRFTAGEGRFCFSAETNYDGKKHIIPKFYDSIIIKKRNGSGWEDGCWQTFCAEPEDFSGNSALAAKHGAGFKLEYDDTVLLLYADVTDDFLFKSNGDLHKGSLCDSLEVYLDGRKEENIGRSAYEKGVCQVMLYPGTPGKYPAFCHSPQGLSGVSVSSEATGGGYRIEAAIPFASFCTEPDIPPKIGFDLGVNSSDETGKRIGQYFFAGTNQNWRNASTWAEVWLK